jgi:aerobic carbon-monoxide dehydrogenase small subunit
MTSVRSGATFHDVTFTVNRRPVTERVESSTSLAEVLRDRLALTGTHLGCEQGSCGACTVLVDGRSARACLLLAVQVEGREVRTVEGLAGPDGPGPLQRAFIDHHALQCGFCTPGFLMLATELVESAGGGCPPSREEICRYLAANICRCTGYLPIVAAVEDVLCQGRR